LWLLEKVPLANRCFNAKFIANRLLAQDVRSSIRVIPSKIKRLCENPCRVAAEIQQETPKKTFGRVF